ncbi:MAG: family Rossman fold protein [Acidobacteria bacterium]|nr:family Rossman fold protein [Acidobacteriota bacterium]
MAAALVEANVGLVYGGGRVGLMGVVADEVLRLGGSATGVIPRTLWEREVGHNGLTELHVVETMHERKAMMAALSDGFIALPGGLGTIEEIFEIWTWGQLGIHAKPIGFLNVLDYYTPLMEFLDHAVDSGFIRPQHRAVAIVDDDPHALLERFAIFTPPLVEKWLTVER